MNLTKKDIKRFLNEKKLEELVTSADDMRKLITVLISLSYNKTDVIAWRAIETIGLVSKEAAKTDPQFVRNLVGRLLWMIRDESGGIGWSAPDSLGEIVRNNPKLCEDIAPIIVSFHFEPPLRSAIMWAVGRVGKINAETTDYALPIIHSFLDHKDNTIRGYSVWALGVIGGPEDIPALERLIDDEGLIDFYKDRDLNKRTIGSVAAEAKEKLGALSLV